jgi:hypothetical protein
MSSCNYSHCTAISYWNSSYCTDVSPPGVLHHQWAQNYHTLAATPPDSTPDVPRRAKKGLFFFSLTPPAFPKQFRPAALRPPRPGALPAADPPPSFTDDFFCLRSRDVPSFSSTPHNARALPSSPYYGPTTCPLYISLVLSLSFFFSLLLSRPFTVLLSPPPLLRSLLFPTSLQWWSDGKSP